MAHFRYGEFVSLKKCTLCAFLVALSYLFPSFQAVAVAQSSDSTDQQHEFSNALTKETSPYLLMHAHNPVNWYGWGEEALNLAKSTGKPIFLSIGYSSCHWCHVMERESFLDEEIADYLNDHFVCIKVDREERPDVDAIYMESLRIVNPRTNGGWPLSMFLTPDALPFFGGTYYPARDGERGARFGFLTIVKRVHETWKQKPEKIKTDAEFAALQVKKRLAGRSLPTDAAIDPDWVAECQSTLLAESDSDYGGFRFNSRYPDQPKFPDPSILIFLLHQSENRMADEKVQTQLVKTCEAMMLGGIQDHIGGGFHRYSVDREWKIPHFEKMLYDNAQLATVYCRLHKLTGRADFEEVARDLLRFVKRELTSPEGGFYSALDAESAGEEGKFYRWTKAELASVLNEDEYSLFAKVYGIDDPPNFEGQYYVPQLSAPVAELAKQLDVTPGQLWPQLNNIREKLLKARNQRERPLTDTKILASWNGMMIRGLADAGMVFGDQQYLADATSAAEFLLDKLVDDDGRLARTYTNGHAKLNAYLTDYACVIDGLLALHQATNEKNWLDAAEKLQLIQNDLFWDEQDGGYFFTSNDHESLLARAKPYNDGPVPSGNSVAASNLIYLSHAANRPEFRQRARRTLLSASPYLSIRPNFAPRLLVSANRLLVELPNDNDDQDDHNDQSKPTGN